MKNFLNRIAYALSVCVLLTGAAFAAGEKSDRVTFSQDMVVNGTVVKKGTYKVVFNDQTGELAIIDGKNTLAKTAVTLKSREGKASKTQVNYTMKSGSNVLNSITFAGKDQVMVLDEGRSQAATPQQ